MLEQIALGVRIRAIQPQAVDESHDLREHGGLVDTKTRTVHEVDGAVPGHLGEERKDLIAHEAHERLAGKALGPDGPAEALFRDPRLALLKGVQRILQVPRAAEEGLMFLLEHLGPGRVLGVDALDQVEEEQERELLGVADRIGVAAAVQVVANLFDRAAHLGG